jgi:hypothetical protein
VSRPPAAAVADSIAYATVEDFEGYVEGWETTDKAALERALHRASRDVDLYVGFSYSIESNGLRFGDLEENPKGLDAGDLQALRNATCAQAEYRIEKGEEWFVHDQHESVSGPDFSTKGKLSRYGPKMREELRYSGIRRAVGGRLIT